MREKIEELSVVRNLIKRIERTLKLDIRFYAENENLIKRIERHIHKEN